MLYILQAPLPSHALYPHFRHVVSIIAPKYIGAGIPAVVQFNLTYYKERANKLSFHHLKLSENITSNKIISVVVLKQNMHTP